MLSRHFKVSVLQRRFHDGERAMSMFVLNQLFSLQEQSSPPACSVTIPKCTKCSTTSMACNECETSTTLATDKLHCLDCQTEFDHCTECSQQTYGCSTCDLFYGLTTTKSCALCSSGADLTGCIAADGGRCTAGLSPYDGFCWDCTSSFPGCEMCNGALWGCSRCKAGLTLKDNTCQSPRPLQLTPSVRPGELRDVLADVVRVRQVRLELRPERGGVPPSLWRRALSGVLGRHLHPM